MTVDPYEQAPRPLDRIWETTDQLGGRAALSDSLVRDHELPTTRAIAQA
ncbi:MAG: hypothetical protein ACLP0J_05780 [Solirubrobacteraceae bacterium]